MNPFLKTKASLLAYFSVVLLYAAAYGILFGVAGRMSAQWVAVDAIVYWVSGCLANVMAWNIINYAIPPGAIRFTRAVMITAAIILTLALVIGMETLAMSICLERHEFREFAATIPLRTFVTLNGLAIFILFYANYLRRNTEQDEIPSPPRRQEGEVIERITVKGTKKIKVIHVEEIEYLQAEGDYVAIVTNDGRWLKEQTMKYYEEHLPIDMFVRIHRSYIVNVARIVRLERYGNLYQVSLRNSENIKVSANGYKALKQQLNL